MFREGENSSSSRAASVSLGYRRDAIQAAALLERSKKEMDMILKDMVNVIRHYHDTFEHLKALLLEEEHGTGIKSMLCVKLADLQKKFVHVEQSCQTIGIDCPPIGTEFLQKFCSSLGQHQLVIQDSLSDSEYLSDSDYSESSENDSDISDS